MAVARHCVIDTMILQKANAPIRVPLREGSLIRGRLNLLRRIQNAELVVLVSKKLLHEYREHVRSPRNDAVTAFFALVAAPDGRRAISNWHTPWSTAEQEKAGKCGFPKHDDHLLRTAILPDDASTIVTEETRLLKTDDCIYRAFGVHVRAL